MKQCVVIFFLLSGLVSPVVLLAQEPLILHLAAPSSAACETLAVRVVGLTQKAVEGLAEKAGVLTRVMRRGDQDQAATSDFRADRLNLNLNQGLVASAKCG